MVKRLPTLLSAMIFPGLMYFSISSTAVAQVSPHLFRISAANSETHPQNQGGIKFAELLEKKSGGKMKAKVYSNGVLGNDGQSMSALQGGSLDMMIGTLNNFGGTVKETLALEFPYLFKTAEEADFIMDGPIGRKIKDKMAEKGIEDLAFFELGFRDFHSRKGQAIKSADDFKGKKLRVQTTAVYIDLVNALGANAVPMGFNETYTALEQGTIDGMSNPPINILDGKFYEVSPNITITNHVYQPSFLGMSKRIYDKLTTDEKNIVNEAAAEAGIYQRKLSRETAVKSLAQLKAKGVTIIDMPTSEIDKMREHLKPVIEKHTKLIGQAFVDEMMQELQNYRKTHK